MKELGVCTHKANTVTKPLRGIWTAEWLVSLQWATGSKKKSRKG